MLSGWRLFLVALPVGVLVVYALTWIVRGLVALFGWAYENIDSIFPLRMAVARGVLGVYALAFLSLMFASQCDGRGSGCLSRPDPLGCYDE